MSNDGAKVVSDFVPKDLVLRGIFQVSQTADGEEGFAAGFGARSPIEERLLSRNRKHLVLVADELNGIGGCVEGKMGKGS